MRRVWIAGLVLALLLALAPAIASALPPCGRNCSGTYESCCQMIWDFNGTISEEQMDLCAQLEASCWNDCVSTTYVRCKTTYSFWCDGSYYSDANFENNAYASTYCGSYLLGSKTNTCW